VRQRELFDEVSDILGERPPVMDSADVLANPKQMLQKLCHTLGIQWIEGTMTNWASGSRASDGVWAPHWYAAVEASTGFAVPGVKEPVLDPADEALACRMQEHYEAMAAFKLI
jgi:hypothetical protein